MIARIWKSRCCGGLGDGFEVGCDADSGGAAGEGGCVEEEGFESGCHGFDVGDRVK